MVTSVAGRVTPSGVTRLTVAPLTDWPKPAPSGDRVTETCCTRSAGFSTACTVTTSEPGPIGDFSTHATARQRVGEAKRCALEDMPHSERRKEAEAGRLVSKRRRAVEVEDVQHWVERAVHIRDAEIRRRPRGAVTPDPGHTQIQAVGERIALGVSRTEDPLLHRPFRLDVEPVVRRIVAHAVVPSDHGGIRRAS